MSKPRVIAVHLLNDLSGSPFVFGQALHLLTLQHHRVHLFTATPSGYGFLSGIPRVEYHRMSYRWSRIKLLTLWLYLSNQLILFLRLLFFVRRSDIIYINSMLPFGAALAGRLRGCRVVYHIHEVSIRPVSLRKLLLAVINFTASRCIYVSRYCQMGTAIPTPGVVIHNALPGHFIRRAEMSSDLFPQPFTVLMVCSLKRYKGVDQFIACADALPGLRFELVLNASPTEIDVYFQGRRLPRNLVCYEAQTDIHPFYARASVVLNLSLPDQWIETFGMTVLEAMYYGRPVIVPPVGGVTELVDDGVEGFYVDSRKMKDLVTSLCLLSENNALYIRMCRAAYVRARSFSKAAFDLSLARLFREISGLTGRGVKTINQNV